ncbi:unnamed protein product [Amoebophrya sp. A25]|nr:unnamed protein product [Amoebophrya sp. A25]|eukprot:GSA25T00012914001.1
MIDLFLLFFTIVAIGSFVLINAKIVFYYEDNDSEKNDNMGLRAVVIAALSVAYIVIFLLPIDIRNSRNDGGLNMEAFWLIGFISIILLILLILPAGMFWLEIQGDKLIFEKNTPGRKLLMQMLLFFFFVFMFLVISFAFLAEARLPIQDYACSTLLDADDAISGGHLCKTSEEKYLAVNVRFDIYLMAVFCFLGWWLFVIFGGVGLTALPMDLLLEYYDRPKPITPAQYASKKLLYAQTAENLVKKAQELQDVDAQLKGKSGWQARKKQRLLKVEYNKFKQSCHLLDKEFSHTEVCMKKRGEHPLTSAIKIGSGVLFALLSFFWILHVFFYMLVTDEYDTPISPFLNDFLAAFEAGGFFVIAAILFAILNMHLLFATVKGCLKVGMRAFCLFSIHPMKQGHTPLNSLMFNAILVNLTSCAIVQFAQGAFRDYARSTTADVLFNAQIKYLKFYRIFFEYNVFPIVLVTWCLLSFAYLIMYPRDKPAMDGTGADLRKALGDSGTAESNKDHGGKGNGGGLAGGNDAPRGSRILGSKELGNAV